MILYFLKAPPSEELFYFKIPPKVLQAIWLYALKYRFLQEIIKSIVIDSMVFSINSG